MDKINITWINIFDRLSLIDKPDTLIYGVPKNGMLLTAFLKKAKVTTHLEKADLILDDLIDSGKTRDYYEKKISHIPFHALFDKQNEVNLTGKWLIFPWEREHPSGQESIQDNIVRQLQYIGEDPNRDGLKETPDRVVRAWRELFAGYTQNPEDIFKEFDGEGIGGLIYLKDIEFFSMCEHHMLPFFGRAHIGYIPNGKVVGISKLARLLDIFSRRLQIQERIAEQVTEALMSYLEPIGAACLIEAKHLCISCRGVQKQHSVMGYSSMKGAFLEDSHNGVAARNEFLRCVK